MSDPSHEVLQTVLQWDYHVQTFPTWEEVRQVEYLRLYGDVNMFVTADAIAACHRLGLKLALSWYERLKRVNAVASTIFGLAVNHYHSEYGSQDTWEVNDVLTIA